MHLAVYSEPTLLQLLLLSPKQCPSPPAQSAPAVNLGLVQIGHQVKTAQMPYSTFLFTLQALQKRRQEILDVGIIQKWTAKERGCAPTCVTLS